MPAGADIQDGDTVTVVIPDDEEISIRNPSTPSSATLKYQVEVLTTAEHMAAKKEVMIGAAPTATPPVLMPDGEDVASSLEFKFRTGEELKKSDTEMPTITVTLEDFNIPTTIAASAVMIRAGSDTANPDNVMVSGDEITLYVPDMDPDTAGIQGIDEGTRVTITFDMAAGIMNPDKGGEYDVKVRTSEEPNDVTQTVMVEATTVDDLRVMPANAVVNSYYPLGITFKTEEPLADGTDKIYITLQEGFQFPASGVLDSAEITVSRAGTSDTGEPDVDLDNNVITLTVPTLGDGNDMILADHRVQVNFSAMAGIMAPATVGDYTVMVHTNKEKTKAEATVTVAEQMVTPPAAVTGVIVRAAPDTTMSATRLTVRFNTGATGALEGGDEITIMAPTFGVPNTINLVNNSVTINGAMPLAAASTSTTGEIILTLKDPVPASRTVTVVFQPSAGITNPDKVGDVNVSVSTTAETTPASGTVAIMKAEEEVELPRIEVIPPHPGADSQITLRFTTDQELSSVRRSAIIFRFHDDFSVTGGRVDTSRVTISANRISGGIINTEPSGVVNPTSATVTYETVDRKPQVRLAVPDMADDDGNQHIQARAEVTVVFQQGSGIMNPTESKDGYEVWYAINNDANIEDSELGKVRLPVILALSGDGGKRGTSVTAVAKGVEGGEAVLFWLDTATAMAGKGNDAPDGMYDPNMESVLCRATAESNDTATCVFEVQNPPFMPGMDLWVNVQDSEGRRVGFLKGSPDNSYDWDAMIEAGGSLAMHPIYHAEVKLDARVSIKPSEVNIGDTVTVSMFDYLPGGTGIEVKIGSVTLDLNAPGVEFRQRAVQGTGEQSFTFSIPATVGGTPIPLGKVRVDVNKTGLSGHDFKADTNITIAGANVTLSQPSILGNQSLSISGSGFSGRGAGNNRCIEQGDVLINNVAVEIIELEDSGQCRDKIELTSSGTFTLTVLLRRENGTIPDPLQTGGTHTVVITDTLGVEGRTTIEIPERTIDVNPKTARPRTAVTVSGRNFVADNPDGSSVAVDLKYDCGGNVRRTVSAEPDSSGNFEETLRVPDDCGIPSTNTITATVVIDGTETTTETTTHDIPEAEVQVGPAQGAIGSEISVTVRASAPEGVTVHRLPERVAVVIRGVDTCAFLAQRPFCGG